MIKDVKIGYVMVVGKIKVNTEQLTALMTEEWNKTYKTLWEFTEKYGLKMLF